MSDADHEKWVQVDLGRKLAIDTIRLVPARPTDFPDTPGFGFPLRYRVEVADDPTFHNASVVVDRTGADLGPQPDEAIVIPARGKAGRFVRVTATRLWMRTRDFVFALSELEVLSDGKNAALGCSVTALDSIEAGRWSTKYLVDGYASRRPVESIDPPGGDRKRLEADAAELSARRQQLVEQSLAPGELVRLQALRAELQELQRKLAELPKPSLVYSGTSDFGRQGHFAPAHEPRPVHLLLRGDVRQPGQLMSPGSVESIGALAATFDLPDGSDEGARRAALARWITDLRNPLTFRSIVNRVWQYHFGRGIVDTPNDFGRMGDEPTHPDLLDWLANWFIDQGQSLKALHRLIVTSSTYRQVAEEVEIKPYNSTFARRQALDADNRYLWRMNRIRLDAESIRDAALYAAGRLDCAMGGPSIQQFLFKDDHSPVYDYTQFKWGGSESGRRSIYRFIVRSVPDPFMDSLDCPDASQLVPKRNTTLQALSLLNNPFIVRHAELLAERVRREADGLAGQVGLACQLTLGRLPSSEESADLIAHANGYGLENVCRILLNSNEFMFID
jgi:hypothetical protein